MSYKTHKSPNLLIFKFFNLLNGFLAAGLIWTFFIKDAEWQTNIALFFLGCVAVAGIYGAISATKRIFFVQPLPAILAIIAILLK
ncbi:DUF1304 domain-containing protein [Chryseobacterium paridis]|uniref:DUF1304 domain-containing protein n=1 Tax=Chryseobacterium paridis TaxID=2800328 RepID=A0ABS1FSG4_9FLAO|nr:DUF1304 domain-containing protein [Chryseobacterium paridis]